MEITSIKAGGFANIRQTLLEIKDMNVLIAPNSYGKSNVLKAVRFGAEFIAAQESNKARMMGNASLLPVNTAIAHQDYTFEVEGTLAEKDMMFCYGYSFKWEEGIIKEWLKIKKIGEQRYRSAINRDSKDNYVFLPTAGARCNRVDSINGSSLAVNKMRGMNLFYSAIVEAINTMNIPYLNTLEDPEKLFLQDADPDIGLLDNRSISEYLYWLKTNHEIEYSLLQDGILAMNRNIETFEPIEIKIAEGVGSTLYDIRIKERYNTQTTSIRQLSTGSKRIVYLFTMCQAANMKGIPLVLFEEPENSVHPKLLENLVLLIRSYTENSCVLFTSHSPYLMRYLHSDKLYFGLPNDNGLAIFAKVRENKRKHIHKYASAMELTVGEFMFGFMLDMEDDKERIKEFFHI